MESLIIHSPLQDYFQKSFQIVLADTNQLVQDVFRLRYRVYCEELHYESTEAFPDGMEQDSYDRRAVYCLLKHRASNRFVGCIRVLLSDPEQIEAKFPFEQFLNTSSQNFDFAALPRPRICEVSRLAIISEFRRHKGDSSHACDPQLTDVERFLLPSLSLGLYLAGASVMIELGMENGFAMMEPRLARHLRRFGLYFQQVAPLRDYHGLRAPFLILPQEIPGNLHEDHYGLFQSLHSDLRMALRSMALKYKTASLPCNAA
jgi:N-acyl amino acid synthase of PEP-CTERM/exosortase system